MLAARIRSSDGVAVTVHHSAPLPGRAWLLAALPLATTPSFVAPALRWLSERFNVVTWEARLLLDDEALPDAGALCVEAHLRDLEAIRDAFGIERALLLGYCSGAALALHAAARFDWIDRLALVNGAYFGRAGDCELTQYERDVIGLMPLVAKGFPSASYVFTKFFKDKPRPQGELAEEMSRPYASAESLYRFGLGLNALIASDLRAAAAGVRAPSLVATGMLDDQTHYSSSLRVRDEIADAEPLIDEQGDHYELCRAKPELLGALGRFFGAA